MFSNLLFLIFVLLIVSVAPEVDSAVGDIGAEPAFLIGLAAYGLTLCCLYLLVRLAIRSFPRAGGLPQLITSGLLLGFLVLFHFVLAAHRAYLALPVFEHSRFLFACVSLFFYLFGLGFFHYVFAISRHGIPPTFRERWDYAQLQIRFVLPFLIPFLLYEAAHDLLNLVPSERVNRLINGQSDGLFDSIIGLAFTLLFLGSIMVFLPGAIQRIWGCRPIPVGPLRDRLESLCQRARFKHAGMMIWTVMNHSITAAIIGIIPRYRYVMFTQGLLKRFKPEEVEAVLAHEIGHSQNHHLLYYPFVVMGMLVCAGLFSAFFDETVSQFFLLAEHMGNAGLWETMRPFALFIPYALLIVVYFRLVFGYFSRLFERQADLHPLQLGIPPENIIGALDHVGIATGHTHDHPSWHHFSLKQRMDFLTQAAENPQLINDHNRRVSKNLRNYMLILLTGALLCTGALIPNEGPVLGSIYRLVSASSQGLSSTVNAPLLKAAVKHYVASHPELGPAEQIAPIVRESFKEMKGVNLPGLLEFYGAAHAFNSNEYAASYAFLVVAWQEWDFEKYPDVEEDFLNLSKELLEATQGSRQFQTQRRTLTEIMSRVRQVP